MLFFFLFVVEIDVVGCFLLSYNKTVVRSLFKFKYAAHFAHYMMLHAIHTILYDLLIPWHSHRKDLMSFACVAVVGTVLVVRFASHDIQITVHFHFFLLQYLP